MMLRLKQEKQSLVIRMLDYAVPSPNRRISGFVPLALRPNSAFGGTSDMRQPLSEMLRGFNRSEKLSRT